MKVILSRRKKVIIAAALVLAGLIVSDLISARRAWARQTSEAPLKLVKREEGCFACGTSVGYLSEVATYSYVVDGVEYLRSDEYECSYRQCARPDYTKACYEPGKPGEATPAGRAVACGQ